MRDSAYSLHSTGFPPDASASSDHRWAADSDVGGTAGGSLKATVLVIGPASNTVGGMASVVAQVCELDFAGRYRTEFFPFTFSLDGREPFHRRALRHMRQLRLLRKVIRRTGAPIVHVHTCSGFTLYRSTVDMLAAQRLGSGVILHIHGAAFDEFYAGAGLVERRLIRWALSRADRVVALSDSWRRKISAMAPNARIVVVENAVGNPTQVAGVSLRGSPRELKPAARGCRFLLLARMDEWKGVDDLLTASARLHAEGVAFELTLAGPPGTAGDAATLNAKIHAKKLESVVRYVGCVRGDEKSGLLEQADVYIQPSHQEGMPIALLEALAHGLPVIATRVGSVPEVISNQREGILVSLRQPDLLASAMRDMAADPVQRQAMSAAARRLARERFSLERLQNDLLSLYDDVRASPRQRASEVIHGSRGTRNSGRLTFSSSA